MITVTSPLQHFRWDLDKTYLKTDFDTMKELVRTFTQAAEEKRNVPGARALLQALLNRGEGEPERRLTFISGSPRQMRRVLAEKLRLDGIEPDAFILKPNLSNLLLFRFKAVRGQVGYKLRALLESLAGGGDVEDTLFGDDAEQDAFIYSLYADLLEGRVDARALASILDACDVYSRDRKAILERALTLPPGGRVRRIYIHLDRRSPTARFNVFGARVVPIYNYFQAALILFGDGLIGARSLLGVVESMAGEGYKPSNLANSMQDLIRRGFLDVALVRALGEQVESVGEVLGRPASDFMRHFRHALSGLEARDPATSLRPLIPERVDYVALAARGKYRRKRVSIPGFGWLDQDAQ